jgi:FkbM family methyltransferase
MYSKNTIKNAFMIFLLVVMAYGCTYAGTHKGNSRYIFIDGGAHKGETIREFEKSNLYSKHPWEIFSFEANPYLIPHIPEKQNVTVLNKAMWVDNKGLDFYFGFSTLAGNVVKTKDTDTAKESIYVDSVDFGQWLMKNFERKDILFVKMDIEGAEYPILNKMLRDGSIEYIDKLYVEFHSPIMDDISEVNDKELVDAIEKFGIPIVIKAMGTPDGEYFNE